MKQNFYKLNCYKNTSKNKKNPKATKKLTKIPPKQTENAKQTTPPKILI